MTVHPADSSTASEQKASVAADALGEYLRSIGVLKVRQQVFAGNEVWPFGAFKPIAPPDGIIVLIGIRDTATELRRWQEGLLRLPPWTGLL
jgi:hypothetical protein